MAEALCAFLDASVLYPVSLRNLLMRLSLESLFQAKWSAKIHEEWINAVLRDNPQIPVSRLHALRDAMDAHVDDAVVTDYEHLIATLTLPDSGDRHVLAAAISGQATVIITRNLRDFPGEVLARHNMRAVHPDEFVSGLIEVAPSVVLKAVSDQQRRLTKPPITMDELLSVFLRLDLRATVAQLRGMKV